MEQVALSSKSVLEMLLKTNRPPTDRESAIIRDSMAPANAKLKVVEAQIFDMITHIRALKLQLKEANVKLQRLREEEAAILDTFADHRKVFSPFRNLPEDILREICTACVEGNIPKLSYRETPLPYILGQISSGMRQVALTTPTIWASMHVEIRPFLCGDKMFYDRVYSVFARKASRWFERAGTLALSLFLEDSDGAYVWFEGHDSDPSSVLFDIFLSYSTRWKEIKFVSECTYISPPMVRIAALTAVDVPLLQSVTFWLHRYLPKPLLGDSAVLTIPTLKHVELKTNSVRLFAVNWASVTSITLHTDRPEYDYYCHSKNEMIRVLEQTKLLVFCDIFVKIQLPEEPHTEKIDLPFLKTLIVRERTSVNQAVGAQSILGVVNAPNLEICRVSSAILDLSLPNFFKQSPRIYELSLPFYNKDNSLGDTIEFLRHCPSLNVLSLQADKEYMDPCDADRFLRAFVKEGDADVICPRLQDFVFRGEISFSLETLRLFLEGRQRESAMPNVLPWKRIAIVLNGIGIQQEIEQILGLVSEKRTAGLDINVCSYYP